MRKYNIIRAIENLYDKAQSTVPFNGSTGEWFKTIVGVRQGCLLSPALFNIFPERIMCETLDDHEASVSIGRRLITNFRFADDIVVNAEEEEKSGVLVDRRDTTTTKVQNGDRPRQDKSDDEQSKRLPKRDQDKRSGSRRSVELQVPRSNHLQRRIKTQDFIPDYSSSF